MKKRVIFKDSSINGIGIFALENINKGEVFEIERTNPNLVSGKVDIETTTDNKTTKHKVTISCRGYNHSCKPNIKLANGKIQAVRDINKDEELVLFYRMYSGFKCNCGVCSGKYV